MHTQAAAQPSAPTAPAEAAAVKMELLQAFQGTDRGIFGTTVSVCMCVCAQVQVNVHMRARACICSQPDRGNGFVAYRL